MLTQMTAVALNRVAGHPNEWPVLIQTEYIVAMWPHHQDQNVTVIQMIKGHHHIGMPFTVLRQFLGGYSMTKAT